MALLSAQSLRIRYGGPPLLDEVSFTLDRGERACLVGRNGEGKSTLLRIVAGAEKPDAGLLSFVQGTRVATLAQVFPAEMPGTVHEVVEAAFPDHAHDAGFSLRLDKLLSQMELDGHEVFDALSGGQKRRVLLARALVGEPDLLLLDEPTNHLDIAGIQWLERFLPRFPGAVLFVTHDRAFLRSVATRILELDRGTLNSWDCDYDTYLRRREELLAGEEKQNALFDKRLAQEERWIRQGVKARRTRNEGRVRVLLDMRNERKARRERTGNAKISVQEAERSGFKVIEAKNLSHSWGTEPVIKDFSLLVSRGDKIGLIGPNGCGKSTLLNLLLGRIKPQTGTVEHGTKLQVTFFDQHRMALEEDKSIAHNVGLGSDFVMFNGQRRHVISYLEDFLFPPARSRTPVKVLSGGERNRLLLAKMFTQPGNVLVMDEPTNDLDIETLELLESLLVDYTGTLLLVSHDREFLNNVVTSTIAFEGDGILREYPGGYDDWLNQRADPAKAAAAAVAKAPVPEEKPKRVKPLTSWEERDWQEIPGKIQALETEMEQVSLAIADAGFYQQAEALRRPILKRADEIPAALEKLYARWESLDQRANPK